MSKWQFDILFTIAALGAVFLPFAKSLGLDIPASALSGYGLVLAYVLTQRPNLTKHTPPKEPTNDKADVP